MHSSNNIVLRALALSSLACAASLAHAEAAPDGLWHGTVAVGGAFASGNTNSKVLTGAADGARVTAADKISLFGNVNYGRNKDSRLNLDTGLGYKIIHDATTTFDVFGGLGWSHAKFTDGTSGQGVTALLGEESVHKLSDTTTFKQRAEFHPGAHDIGNLATFDASLATAISGGWTLNTALAVRYASKVPAGLKKTDTLLTVGFGYKF